MKLKKILILFTLLIIISIIFFIVWHFPVKRKMSVCNCEVSYDYFREGGGYGYKIFTGPNYYYPNEFWYKRAKIKLLKCLCDNYETTKDTILRKSIIDSIRTDEDFFSEYLAISFRDSVADRSHLLKQNKKIEILIDSVCKYKEFIFSGQEVQ